jgi:large subunit ribosomal protein L13
MKKKTFSQTKEAAISSARWVEVDASGIPLGRLASQVAHLIRGKHKPTFTPHVNCGDYVIVLNPSLVRLAGKKLDQKIYYSHSGYISGLKSITAKDLLKKRPESIIENAVRGMLPKGALGHQMLKKLRVVNGSEHNYQAQKPEKIEISI